MCEYRTHHEGVLQEEITLVTRGRKDSSLKVRFQARVIGMFLHAHTHTNEIAWVLL